MYSSCVFASCLRVVCGLCGRQAIFHCCVIFHRVTVLRFVRSPCSLAWRWTFGPLALGQCSQGERPARLGQQPCVAVMSHRLRAVCHAAPVTGQEGRGCPGWCACQLLVLRGGWGQGKSPEEDEDEQTLYVSKHTLSRCPKGRAHRDPFGTAAGPSLSTPPAVHVAACPRRHTRHVPGETSRHGRGVTSVTAPSVTLVHNDHALKLSDGGLSDTACHPEKLSRKQRACSSGSSRRVGIQTFAAAAWASERCDVGGLGGSFRKPQGHPPCFPGQQSEG